MLQLSIKGVKAEFTLDIYIWLNILTPTKSIQMQLYCDIKTVILPDKKL